jgi:hypothetical protein
VNRLAFGTLSFGLIACQGVSPAPAPPAAAANAVAAGNVAASNAIRPPPPLLELKGTAALAVVGATLTPLDAGSENAVDPRATFRVELPLSLADARLSLLDGADAMLPCSGTREVGQATVLALTPAAALAPGARLRLRVDGAATRELQASDGRRFRPLEWMVVVTGEAEPRKGPGKRGKRR